MRWPIKYQLVLLLVIMSIAIVVLLTMITSYFAFRQTESKIRSDITNTTSTISQANYPITPNTLSQIKGFSGAEFLVVDLEYKPLASTLDNSSNVIRQIKNIDGALKNEFGQVIELDNESYYVMETSTKKSAYRPQSKLYVLYPKATYAKQIRRAWMPPVIAGVVGCFLIGLTGFIVASRISQNLAKLRNQVNVIAKGEFQEMELPSRNDEIRDLTVSVNQMASQLQSYETQIRSSERQKTFEQLGRTIAHELRNAVTGGKMAIELQQRKLEGEDTSEYLDVAHQQFRVIEKSVDRFLSLDKPTESTRSEFSVNELVQSVVQLIKPNTDHLNVELLLISPENEILMFGRRGDLQQAILNIALNAVDAAAANSARPSKVELQLAELNDTISVSVKDSGVGPSQELAGRLFEPFATDKPDGLGLGLALTKQVVESHDGRVEWSRIDDQTEFRFLFPKSNNETEV